MQSKPRNSLGNFLVVIIVIAAAFFAYRTYFSNSLETPIEIVNEIPSATGTTSGAGNVSSAGTPPAFAWSFEQDDSLNADGLPQTNVYLTAKYADRRSVSKLVATAPGSCNELPDFKGVKLASTKAIQCYAAGYGDIFKIVKGDSSYLIQRKEFEEGSPEYNPPVQPFKTVAEFSF